MKKIVVLLMVVGSLSSCGMVMGTPSGVREISRWQNGAILTGKAEPNELDEWSKTERFTEEQKTLRITLGGSDGRAK